MRSDKTSPPLIACEDLSMTIQGKEVLHNIQLRVQKNEITALIGPESSGKTMLLLALNRMYEEVEGAEVRGRIFLDEHNVLAETYNLTALRQQVGMIFKKPAPFAMSIYRNLVYGPRLQGITAKPELDEMAKNALEEVGLWRPLKDKARTSALLLPLLQQQKLCIARALCAGAKVLLMDDPCAMLDHTEGLELEQLLERLKARYTVVLTTRHPHQAARISDYCALIMDGRIVEAGPTNQMFTQPVYPQTEAFITGRAVV